MCVGIARSHHLAAINRKPFKCSVARLKCLDAVARGHVLLNRSVSTSLDVSAHSSVQLRVLKLPEIAPLHVALKVHQESASGGGLAAEQLQEAFLHWIQQLSEGLVAHSGSIIQFEVTASGESVSAMMEVNYDAEENISAQELEGEPRAVNLCALVPISNQFARLLV